MRLGWATDIHLDHAEPLGVEELAAAVETVGIDGLLVTGDIAEAPSVCGFLERLVAAVGVPVHFVLGNHDYYRGSIEAVRARVRELVRGRADLIRLEDGVVVPLSESSALVGVDGWSDARTPDFMGSRVMLNDYLLIAELALARDKADLRDRLIELGRREAEALARTLESALARYPRVIVATHPPPFREACWYQDEPADDQWAPHFTCLATGEALARVARAHPHRELLTLCGHTHGERTYQPLPNLMVRTAFAVYGRPMLAAVLEV